jgi:flagellar basal-body rod modification protein FlgD
LGQDDFLKLMTVQVQNQDPLKPMENTEFFSQIAQFSTVSGIEKLQGSFSDLASQLSSSQSLQAASLIGHDVLVQSDVGVLYNSGMDGAVDVPSSGDVHLEVRDGNGVLVRTLDLGTQPAGQLAFNWDGTDSDGAALPQGLYKIAATVQSGSSSTAAATYALDQVSSVSLKGGSLNVDMLNLGEVAFTDVSRIQ